MIIMLDDTIKIVMIMKIMLILLKTISERQPGHQSPATEAAASESEMLHAGKSRGC